METKFCVNLDGDSLIYLVGAFYIICMSHVTKEVLEELYHGQRLSREDVGKLLGVGATTVLTYMKKFGIQRRANGEAIKGVPKTNEQKKKQSIAMRGPNHHNFGKKCNSSGKRCWYILPGGRVVSMRSRWEVWYAEYLREKGVPFDYEPTTFTLRNGRAYTPDFLVMEDNGIGRYFVEVKGWMTPEHKNRLEAFYKEYPQEKLVIADRKYLQQLGINLRKNWISEKPLFECELCHLQYHRSYPQQKFCSVKCRNSYSSRNRGKSQLDDRLKRAYKGVQKGEKNNSSKLTESQVLEILRLRQEGLTLAKVAEQTGATPGNISNILNGKSWKHIPR